MPHILLLEPDAILGSTYRDALKNSGHSVDWQTDAQTAVHAIDTCLPDVIITELELAVHNGIEFLYELRSYGEWQKLPVIVLSQVPSVDTGLMRALWQELDITAYHYKPLTKLSDLVRTVERMVVPAT